MLTEIGRLYRDEDGTTSVEYALLLALVVAAGLVAWRGLGTTLGGTIAASTETIANGGA